jgi:hypothetical protein
MHCARWTLTLVIMLSTSMSAAGDPTDSLVGTWRLVSMTYKDATTGAESDLWGARPIGFLTYTASGRMSAVITAASRKLSTASVAEAPLEEQAALMRSTVAYAGTYRLTDTGVTHQVEVATDPGLMGKDQIRYTKFEGKQLTVTGPPIRTVGTPNPMVLQLVWDRIE